MTDNKSNAGVAHWAQDIHQGDAVEVLQEMPESSVECSWPDCEATFSTVREAQLHNEEAHGL